MDRGIHTRNIVILACAIESADKALLPATFKALSSLLDAGPKALGALTFAQSIGFSVALPLWGALMRSFSSRDLLATGCFCWAVATLALAFTSTFTGQLWLRVINGAALAAVSPLGQALLCDVVPEGDRGKAFGLLQSSSHVLSLVAGTVATGIAMESVCGMDGWRVMHIVVAVVSALVGVLVRFGVAATKPEPSADSWLAEQWYTVRRIFGKPSFIILVLQGVSGGVPWNGFAFLTLYFQLSGYADWEASRIVLFGGFGGMVGGYLGGFLGDLLGRWSPNAGRIATAQTSVLCGIALFLWVLHVPFGPGSLGVVCTAHFVFNLVACWTPAAACRPICGVLFRESRERAQVLALWCALEGIISSVCGAPLTGKLSEAFGFRLHRGGEVAHTAENARALRKALQGVAVVPWALCAAAWLPMYWAYPKDRCKAAPSESEPLVMSGKKTKD